MKSLTIDEIKAVSIIGFLDAISICHSRVKGDSVWYCSPLRTEATPSFKVSKSKNLWYDHGRSCGGNLINLVQYMYPTWNNHQVLLYLEKIIRQKNLTNFDDSMIKDSDDAFDPQDKTEFNGNRETVIEEISDLTHPNLIYYIKGRRINPYFAKQFCKEIHYKYGDKHYYAIGFPNVCQGYEIRNKLTKRCIGKKTVSYFRQNNSDYSHICVFEGFFDFLTYLTLNIWSDVGIVVHAHCDYLILNSTSCVHKSLPYLKGYKVIHCYLDNDESGKNAVSTINKAYPKNTIDESIRYRGYNDLNDVVCGIRKTQPTGK